MADMDEQRLKEIEERRNEALSMPCEVYDVLLETDIPDLVVEVRRLKGLLANPDGECVRLRTSEAAVELLQQGLADTEVELMLVRGGGLKVDYDSHMFLYYGDGLDPENGEGCFVLSDRAVRVVGVVDPSVRGKYRMRVWLEEE